MKIGVLGGGFKPPHKGHYDLAKQAFDYGIDELRIYIGPKARSGANITQDQAIAIWKEYAKSLPGRVVLEKHPMPIRAPYTFARENTDHEILWFLGQREGDDGDTKDIHSRTASLRKDREKPEEEQKYRNLDFQPIYGRNGVSGTKARQALQAGDKEATLDMLPSEVDKEAVYKIIMDTPEGRMAEAIDNIFEGMLFEEEVEEGSGGVPIDAIGAVASKDKATMDNRFKYFTKLTPPDMTISRRGMEIIITLNKFAEAPDAMAQDLTPTQNPLPEQAEAPGFNFTPYIASILEYCIDRKFKILPLPEIKIKYDEENASNLFGRTGYYQPQDCEICLYASGRHPKDVLRSFCHELIHHIQNMEGKDLTFTTTDVHADEALMEIEKEAHSKGSLLFREWENSQKEQESIEEKKSSNESRGRLNPIANKLSSIAFKILKTAHEKGQTIDHTLMIGPYEDADIKLKEIEFDLRIILRKGDYNYTGGADSGQETEDDPYVEVVITLPEDYTNWTELSMHLKDLMRHEIEHLKQGGINVRRGGEMEDDALIRSLINIGDIPEKEYYKLPKEVDAMIQGLKMQAQKSRRPFMDVAKEYLESQGVSLKDQEEILSLWSKRLPALGIKQ